MSFPVSLVGDVHQGEAKWAGGALASDGCIYAAPMFALQILKIDPKNLTTTEVGPPISGFGKGKYVGAVATNDGFVYFVPYQAAQVLKFNIETQEIELIGEKFPSGTTASNAYKWLHGVVGKDGCIYCSPSQANQILKVDPSDDSTSLVGDELGEEFFLQKYSSAVASKDKATIYFIPAGTKPILQYDVDTERCTYISTGHLNYGNSGNLNWTGGAIGPDGCIYAAPYDATKILKYDPSRKVNDPTLDDYDETTPENPTLVGEDLGSEKGKWNGCIFGRDGYLYGIPNAATKVLRFNPLNETTALVGIDFPRNFKWCGGVLDNNGNIVGIPMAHPRVLRIIPSLFNYNPRSETSYQAGGMGDSPNDRTDRLGYELYAEALVDHILSVERTGESVSVGFFAPWGSGKSFFWNLSRKEFARRDKQEREESQGSTTEQEVETDEEKSLWSFVFDMLRQLDTYRGTFLYWPVAILFWVIITPLVFIYFFFLYLQAVFTIFDFKLTNSSWGDTYEFLKGKYLSLQKNLASFTSLALLAIPLLRQSIWKVISVLLRSFFCCYKRGMWRIERHKHTIFIYVEFDAWTYRGTDNIWASILEMLWRAVEEELGSEKVKWHRAGIALAASKLSDPLDIRLEKEEMARKRLQIKWNFSLAFVVWSLVALTAALPTYISRFQSYDGDSEDCKIPGLFGCFNPIFAALVVSTIVSIVNLAIRVKTNEAILQPGSNKITDKVNSYKRKDFKEDVGFMGTVKEEVTFLFEFLKSQNARIRLFVDDLDRCNQDVAMDVLWAICLLFGTNDGPCPITSFLAIDTKVLVDYIEDEFDGNTNGFGYLEKIINLPFSIPPIDNEKKIEFCERAVDTYELNVSQVYRKALNFKYKHLGKTQNIVDHLSDGTLKMDDKNAMILDLISMGEKMNSSGEEGLAGIDFDLLVPINVIERSSRQEALLAILLRKIDILEDGIQSFHKPYDVYNHLYGLLSENEWLGDMLGILLSPPREHEFLVLSMRKEDDLVQELYEQCCVSARSENMRKAFPTPEKLGQLKGIEWARTVTQHAKNLTEDLDKMLKNLDVKFVLQLCRKHIHTPVAPPDNMNEEDELCLLALSLNLEAPIYELSHSSEDWKQFLFEVQLVLKTQLQSQTSVRNPGAKGDVDESNLDGNGSSSTPVIINRKSIGKRKSFGKVDERDKPLSGPSGDGNGSSSTPVIVNRKRISFSSENVEHGDTTTPGSNRNGDGISGNTPITTNRKRASFSGGNVEDRDESTLSQTKIDENKTDSEEHPFYEYRSMVTDDERKFLRVYSCFLDGVPRKIKRILNVYNVTRYIAKKANGGSVEPVFLEKLFILTILQELCPYRTSWLMFISHCAKEEDDAASSLEVEGRHNSIHLKEANMSFVSLLQAQRNDNRDRAKDESMSFCSLLEDLKLEEGCHDVKDLSLATIHSRIVCGVLHCIPSAERNLRGDSGVMSYERLLKSLVLEDLFPHRLKKYAFNLPRSMMNEIKMYKNHSVIGKRMGPEEGDKSFWLASFQRKSTLDAATIFETSGTFDGVVRKRSNL